MKNLNSLGVSIFCENLAMMLAAGIPTENAMELLAEDSQSGLFCDTAKAVLAQMETGNPLGDAIEKAECFPDYAVHMIQAGELSGRTEGVLRNLSAYYSKQSQLENKLKNAVIYPAVFLMIMAIIMILMVVKVLPVFTDVYANLSGDLTVSSYSYVNTAYIVGYCVLGITLLLVLILLVAAILGRSRKGQQFLGSIFQKLPVTAGTAYALSLSQFMAALSTFIASGVDSDRALREAAEMVSNTKMAEKLSVCKKEMEEGQSLAQAFQKEKLFDPLYTRLLLSGARSGSLELATSRLSDLFDEDTDYRLNKMIDIIEPALALFLTVSVGLTLITVMLPLIGILGAIG